MKFNARRDIQGSAGELQCKSILFVCWGNVCRSPAAEMILKREMNRRGFGNVKIKSAGIAADCERNRPSFGMKWAALCRGFWLRPKPAMFQKIHCSQYDLIIAMDRRVQNSIKTMAKQAPMNVKLMSDFLPQGWPVDVPDPMNRSVAKCNQVLDMLHRACREMVDTLGLPAVHGEPVGYAFAQADERVNPKISRMRKKYQWPNEQFNLAIQSNGDF
jgi:protein-tyrosine phosphatase